jgi:alanyl-tRNA synthetase
MSVRKACAGAWTCSATGSGYDPSGFTPTVFGGDDQTGPDTESLQTWGELGVPVELLVEENWWSNGPTGPCGPDSEVLVWTGEGPPSGTPGSDDRWLELWNHVTMRYRRLVSDSRYLMMQRQRSVSTVRQRLMSTAITFVLLSPA